MSGIRIRGLMKSYGHVPAVRGIDLEVARGAFVTLLGPSGSGKTTTLRMIAGLETPDAGDITVGDRTVHGPGIDVPTCRRNMGMVFQSYAVWPHKNVYDNVAFPLQMRKIAGATEKERVDRMLELVELPPAEYAKRYPWQLSGGQQQRVSLARALVAGPEVILFDEPLSNLDARLRESMRILLRSIHDRLGMTSIYVTHDQAEALVLSDRICVMRDGAVVQEASPRDIYEAPKDLFVGEFIGQANVWGILAFDRAASTVDVGGGLTLRVPTSSWRGGTARPSHVLVRHHHVDLSAAGSTLPIPPSNVIRGHVLRVAYLGDRIRYEVDVGSGRPIVIEATARAGMAPLAGEVDVSLPVEGCVTIY